MHWQPAWLVVGLSYPVDLVVIEVSGGSKEVHYIMLLDLPGPVTWTPSAPSVIMGRRGG
jgi:hypothetical protein